MGWKNLLKIFLGISMISAILYFADISEAIEILLETDPLYYSLAVLIFFIALALKGVRWFIMNRLIDEKISVLDSTKVYLVNYAISTAFIGNLADAGRYLMQEQYTEVENKYAVTGAVIVEKILDLFSVLSVVIVSTGFILRTSPELIAGILTTTKSVISNMREEGVLVIDKMRQDRIRTSYLISSSLIIWWLEAISFYVIAISLNADITFFQAALTTSVMTLASAIPITPGGLGTSESAGYAALFIFGISSGLALALIAAQRLLETLISSIPGTLIYVKDYMIR